MTTIHNIHNHILQKIQSGAIKQKPKWYFVLMMLLVVFGFIALSLIFLYLISFVALVFREHLIFDALSFGPQTVFALMHTLPFLLIVLVTTVFLLLHVLVRHFAFAYMKPVMATFGAGLVVTLLVFIGVLVMDKNSRIAHFGEGRHVPGIDILHAEFRDRIPREVIHGTVEEVKEDGYEVKDGTSTELRVYTTERTRMDKVSYEVGDLVAILAEKKEEKLYAIGIRSNNGMPNQAPTSHK